MVTESVATFGDLLRQHRRAAGLTQEELAERSGLSVHGIQKLERGITHPYRDTAQRLLAALQLAPEDEARFQATVQPVRRHGAAHEPTSTAETRHNLPLTVTTFVGRESAVGEITELLGTTRLLTLTGVGGCGKTRLGVEVARGLVTQYSNGVWLVELGPITDPALVTPRVAAALGVRETAESPLIRSLVDAVRPRRLLLILDNCEHLLDAYAQLLDGLLRACPEVRVLATSREPVGIAGEVVWRVPSLSLPDTRLPTTPQALEDNPCVRLFVDRARALQPRFALTEHNAPAVARVCQRLDGIPLALELAAARVGTLTVEQVALRIDQRFRLLTGGSRTALPRQQTLSATLDWSYDLLTRPERRLFEMLAIFTGGWTLEAAEAICGPPIKRDNVLDLLARLTRKSLVVAEEGRDGTERYTLLETVRDYARQKLASRGLDETSALRRRHAEFHTALAQRLDVWTTPGATSSGESAGGRLGRVEVEYDNIRSALSWWIENEQPEAGPQLAYALHEFWLWRGLYTEARSWLERLLDLDQRHREQTGTPAVSPALSAAALDQLGTFASRQGDYQQARAALEACAALRRELGQQTPLAPTLAMLGLVLWCTGEPDQATTVLEESRRLLAESDRRDQDACDWAAMTLRNLGIVARSQQQYARAADLFQKSVGWCRSVEVLHGYSLARSLCHLGRTEFLQGQLESAIAHFRESLAIMRDGGIVGHNLADCLDWLAATAGQRRRPVQAALLFGAADAQWKASGAVRYAPDRPQYERDQASVRAQLEPAAFTAAWAEGDELTADQAISFALQEVDDTET
jgi:predicted ATPase/transcriptional regulator with XRE-family HTH domain